MDKLDQTSLKEDLPKLHSSYYGVTEEEAEFEFLKVLVSQGADCLGCIPFNFLTLSLWDSLREGIQRGFH